MMLRPLAALTCAALFIAPALAQPAVKEPAKETPVRAGKVNLRPKFKVGQVSRFKLSMDTRGSASDPTLGEQQQNIFQEIGIALKVKDVKPEQGATLELVYESMKLKLTPPGGGDPIEFDSSAKGKGDDDVVASVLKPIIGLTLTLKADKDGNITSIDGGSSLNGAAAGLAGQFTGADAIRSLVGPIVSSKRGEGEAAVGESWTNDDTIDAPWGKMHLRTTNTLKSHRAGVADIDIKGAFSLEPGSAAGPAPSVKDSSLSGSAKWNTETGMLSEMNVKQRIVVEDKTSGKRVNEMVLKVNSIKN